MSTDDDRALSRFGTVVAQTARLWRRAADRRLQPYGLTEATWLPLLHISRAHKPMLQKELAASISLDNSSVVRLIDNLEAAGYVRRREGEDRRAKEIILTDDGRAIVENVERVAATLRAELMQDLPREDLAAAARVLDHLCDHLARVAEGGDE